MHAESLTAAPTASGIRLDPAGALVLVGALGAAITLTVLVLGTQTEVLREGNFVGYANVQEVELFGQTFYRDPVRIGIVDAFNSFVLIAIATVSFFACLLLSATRRWSAGFIFFLLAATGAAYLAADEVLSIHETLGHNLPFLADLPGISHPDDAVFASYAVPAALFAYRFRALIASSRPAFASLALGGALFAASSAMDISATTGEEGVEPLATLALLVGFCILATGELRRQVLRSQDTADAVS